MMEQWAPSWTRHRPLLPALREEIFRQASALPGGAPPFRLHDGREVPWPESPNGSDEGLLRFLQARSGAVEASFSAAARGPHCRVA
mmetsp:Transcript_38964/g.125163  ORF Transcript_38964/g.125163 Transcript_38964/m.125163 type:complete len:86 (+) Transcript_38964:109-366(+)